jgi:hypothetical protein
MSLVDQTILQPRRTRQPQSEYCDDQPGSRAGDDRQEGKQQKVALAMVRLGAHG